MRLEIVDNKTGVCLFEKIWKWKVNPDSGYSSLCKYIKSLFLISRSLQENKIKFVDYGGNGANKLRLSCLEDNNILVGLFHTISDDLSIINELLLSIKEEFINIFDKIQDSLRNELDSIVNEHIDSLLSEDEVLIRFNEFDKSVCECVEKIYPNNNILSEEDQIVSETEESDSKKTSEKSKEKKNEEEEILEEFIP